MELDYSGSGIKTLRFMGKFFFWIGLISAFVLLIIFFVSKAENWNETFIFLLMCISSIFTAIITRALFNCIATIAESALIYKTNLAKTYSEK